MPTNTKSYGTTKSYGNTRGWKTGSYNTNNRYGGYSTRNTTNTTTHTNTTTSYSPAQFKPYRNTVHAKIGSFRTLEQQCTGSGRVTTFSPTTFNRWINMVNKGCCVYTFSTRDMTRWFGRNYTGSTNNTLNQLRKKFGTGVKACAPTRNNCWLVCATPSVTATPFSSYTWK